MPAWAAFAGQQWQGRQAVFIGDAAMKLCFKPGRIQSKLLQRPLINIAAFAGRAADQGLISAQQITPQPARHPLN